MIGIYKITSPSGRVYIGQTVDFERRIRQYSNNGCKKQVLIYNSIKKYGWDKHTYEMLCECEVSELNELERYYQDLYSCVGEDGLNLRLTKSTDRSGFMSEESKIKMSINSHRFWLGKNRSECTKEKISIKLTGNKMSQEAKDKMSKNNSRIWLGKKFPQEMKDKMSSVKKGKISNCTKIIIDVSNGIFYNSLREASLIYSIKETTLCMQLKGVNKNKTNLRYA